MSFSEIRMIKKQGNNEHWKLQEQRGKQKTRMEQGYIRSLYRRLRLCISARREDNGYHHSDTNAVMDLGVCVFDKVAGFSKIGPLKSKGCTRDSFEYHIYYIYVA